MGTISQTLRPTLAGGNDDLDAQAADGIGVACPQPLEPLSRSRLAGHHPEHHDLGRGALRFSTEQLPLCFSAVLFWSAHFAPVLGRKRNAYFRRSSGLKPTRCHSKYSPRFQI